METRYFDAYLNDLENGLPMAGYMASYVVQQMTPDQRNQCRRYLSMNKYDSEDWPGQNPGKIFNGILLKLALAPPHIRIAKLDHAGKPIHNLFENVPTDMYRWVKDVLPQLAEITPHAAAYLAHIKFYSPTEPTLVGSERQAVIDSLAPLADMRGDNLPVCAQECLLEKDYQDGKLSSAGALRVNMLRTYYATAILRYGPITNRIDRLTKTLEKYGYTPEPLKTRFDTNIRDVSKKRQHGNTLQKLVHALRGALGAAAIKNHLHGDTDPLLESTGKTRSHLSCAVTIKQLLAKRGPHSVEDCLDSDARASLLDHNPQTSAAA